MSSSLCKGFIINQCYNALGGAVAWWLVLKWLLSELLLVVSL